MRSWLPAAVETNAGRNMLKRAASCADHTLRHPYRCCVAPIARPPFGTTNASANLPAAAISRPAQPSIVSARLYESHLRSACPPALGQHPPPPLAPPSVCLDCREPKPWRWSKCSLCTRSLT